MITAELIIKEALKSLGEPTLNRVETELTNEEYHENKFYISRSAIMDFNKSPYTYWAKHLNPFRPKKDSTAAMQMGSAFHTMILEPDLFWDNYDICPPKVLLKDVGRDVYEAYKAKLTELETTKKVILTYEEDKILCEMQQKFFSNEQAMQLVKDARIENSFFWQDEHSTLLLKSRPDILHENIIVDLKTTSDASPRAFQNEMVKYGYHIQFAMIRDAVEKIEGRRITNFINLVIETKYPYNMAIYIIDEFAVDEGQVKYKNICLDMKRSLEENSFQDYGIQTISLPKWAING